MQELKPQIPNYVSAVTPLGLRRAMLRNNANNKLVFNYYSIQFVNGRWYAWFYAEIANDDEMITGET